MTLVLRYKFNDPATFTTDSSGNSNTLEDVNGVGSFDDPTYGSVAHFSDNPTKYFSLASAPATTLGSSSRTYSYWLYQIGTETYRIMFGQGTSPEYRVQFSNSSMDINGGSGGSSNPSSIGEWVHIGITYDGSTERVYFDGALTNSANISINTGTGSLFIGSAPNFPTGYSINGYMVDFRIYDDALSDADISTLYANGPNPDPDTSTVTPTVDWVQDSSSRYEVSSKEHLLQIMQNGTYLPNTGSTPANYRSVSFIQTADIDLESDIANIVPISTFTGTYDGQNFAISNWSCTPVSGKGTALFGYTSGATIQNCVLNGVWSTLNTNDGALFAAHNSNSTFTNISGFFSPGTEITAVANSLGGLFSYTGRCTVQNVTLGGTFDTFQGTAYTGGIVGYSSGSTYSHVRNIATFATPLTGNQTGGIAGYYGGTSEYILNAMRGDIQGSNRTGGVYGLSSGGLSYVCNSMIGDISGTSAAGVVSSISNGGTCSFILNYMTGDVAHGLMGSSSSTTLVNSIVAMTGATSSAAFGSGHGSSQVLLDESYGITYTSNAGTVATMDTSAFANSSGETSQPYWEFTNSPQWPFVFGNVGINTSFDWILASGSSDTAVFTGVNELSVPVPVVILPDPVTVSPGVYFADLEWEAVEGAVSYRVTYSSENQETIVSTSGTSIRLYNLEPNSAYTVTLFKSEAEDGVDYEQVGDPGSFSTLENVSSNIDVETLKNAEGVVDLSNFASDVFDQHLDTLLDTGEQVVRTLNDEEVTTTFVKSGGSLPLETGVFSLPFSTSLGGGQEASLGDVTFSFDEANDYVIIDGVAYYHGDSINTGGKVITVYNV